MDTYRDSSHVTMVTEHPRLSASGNQNKAGFFLPVLEGPKAYLILSLESLPEKLLNVFEISCSFSTSVSPYPAFLRI